MRRPFWKFHATRGCPFFLDPIRWQTLQSPPICQAIESQRQSGAKMDEFSACGLTRTVTIRATRGAASTSVALENGCCAQ
jgi:hypothetical protein